MYLPDKQESQHQRPCVLESILFVDIQCTLRLSLCKGAQKTNFDYTTQVTDTMRAPECHPFKLNIEFFHEFGPRLVFVELPSLLLECQTHITQSQLVNVVT